MYKIVAYSFPNNEIRIQRSQSRPMRRESVPDENGEVECEILQPDDHTLWQSLEKIPPLSLGSNSKPERHSAGYGNLPAKPSTFGLNAKRSLIRAGAAMDSDCLAHERLFLTGTLPGSTDSSFRAIAAYSGHIVNGLKAWVAKYVKAKLDFYCWEYQKRGALHLHYCVHIPTESDRSIILGGFKSWWIQAMHRIGDLSSTDMFRKDENYTHLSDTSKIRAVAEVCRKSPSRYLAKYLSKSVSPARGSARLFTPSRWWGTSRPLKALLAVKSFVVNICEGGYQSIRKKWELVKHVYATSESVTYSYVHKFGMGETVICYPNSPIESKELWIQLQAQSSMNRIQSTIQHQTPSMVLKIQKVKMLDWCHQSLNTLSPSFQGLNTSLMTFLSMTTAIIPSQSQAPLSMLLHWSAQISDMRLLLRYSPLDTRESKRLFQQTLDILDQQIEIVASDGWS